MTFACQVMATWRPADGCPEGCTIHRASRVYIETMDDGNVVLRLPGQGSIRLDPSDAAVVGSALVEAAKTPP